MKAAALLLCAAALAAPALAQEAPAAAPAACRPTTSLDDMIKALDAAISGPVDQDRTCLRDVLLPNARLVARGKGPDGNWTNHVLTIDDWIDTVRKRGGSVYEKQIRFSSQTFGQVSALWSTYELRTAADGPPLIRGINSIQAVQEDGRWRVLNILWQAESADTHIPAQYLP